MDIILYILPVFLIVLLLPKYFMVLLAKCVDNALFREKIIDKEIRRKLYRNGVIADLIASFSMIVIGFIQNIIESPSYYFTDLEDYLECFNLNFFSFFNAPFYSSQSMFKGSFLFILVTIIISALISLYFDYFTIFRNPDLTKKQKICTLLIFVLMTAPYYFLISPTLFYKYNLITVGFSRIVEHNYLTKSRGKQGYDEEDIFTLMMVYASKDGIDERLNLWEWYQI